MDMKIVGITVTVLVSLVVLAGVLMPVLDDATATTDTFTNEGYYNLTYSETDDVSLTWDYTKPNVVTVNGEDVTLNVTTTPGPMNIACGDNWFLRWNTNQVQFFSTNTGSVNASVSDSTSLTLTASNGSATVTNTASTPVSQTVSYTFIYVVDSDGPYVMKTSTESVYLKGDSDIYAIGRSSTTGIIIKLKITGNIDDGFIAEEVGTSSATAVGTPVATYSDVSGYKDLYSLSTIIVPVDFAIEGTPASFTPSYSYFIVPAEVTAERAVHFTDNQNALFAVIPVLIIVAILIGVVALVIRSRLD